eukprot:905603-Rhodomonas_salina.1
MCGTEIAYAGALCGTGGAVCGTEMCGEVCGAMCGTGGAVCGTEIAMCGTEIAYAGALCGTGGAMCGTEIEHAGAQTAAGVRSRCYAMSGTDIAADALLLCNVRYWYSRICATRCPVLTQENPPARYAMSGTDIGCQAYFCYGLGYHTCKVASPMPLCLRYGMSGADVAYPIRCPVL